MFTCFGTKSQVRRRKNARTCGRIVEIGADSLQESDGYPAMRFSMPCTSRRCPAFRGIRLSRNSKNLVFIFLEQRYFPELRGGLIDTRNGRIVRSMSRVALLVFDIPGRTVRVAVYRHTGILVYRYSGNPNFGRSVLGCIEADFCK